MARADRDPLTVAQPRRTGRYTSPVWSLSTRAGGALAVAVLNVLLARRLTTADFGTLAVVTSVATLGAFVVSAGLNRSLLRNVAASLALDRPDQAAADLRMARRILALTVPVGAVMSGAVAYLFTRDHASAVELGLLGGLLALAAGLVLLGSDVLRGLGEVRLANLTAGRNGGALVTGLFVVLILAAGRTGLTVTTALWFNLAGLVVAGVAVAVLFRRHRPSAAPAAGSDPTATLDPALRRALLVASAAFAGTQIAGYLSTQIDLWVGNAILSPTDVGVYAGALEIMTVVALPLFAAQLVVIPRVSALHAQGRSHHLEQLVRRTATMVTVPAVLFLIPCIVAPGEVLTILFGKAFAPGGFALAVLALGQLVNVISGLCGTVLAMTSHERLVLWISIGGAVLSAACDVVGASLWGIDGLAVASALTTSAVYVTMWVLARRRTGMWTHPGWPRVDPELEDAYSPIR